MHPVQSREHSYLDENVPRPEAPCGVFSTRGDVFLPHRRSGQTGYSGRAEKGRLVAADAGEEGVRVVHPADAYACHSITDTWVRFKHRGMLRNERAVVSIEKRDPARDGPTVQSTLFPATRQPWNVLNIQPFLARSLPRLTVVSS